MSIFKNFLARLMPEHTWAVDEAGCTRTCTCCGKRQEIGDDAMCCPVWTTIDEGQPAKHYNQ